MFQKILMPVDGSPCSQKATQIGLALAKKIGARVVFTHAQAAYSNQDEGLRMLAPYQKMAQEAGVEHQIRLTDGDTQNISDAIIAVGQATDCDLVVMGTHGREGIARLLLGSVAERVSRHAQIPVLLVHENTVFSQFKNILVAVDGSPAGFLALTTANDLAAVLSAKLEIINIIPEVSTLFGYSSLEYAPAVDLERYKLDLENSSQTIIKAAKALLESNPNKPTYVGYSSQNAQTSSVGNAILEAAKEADLIVLGTHGYGGFERLLLGSVAEQVSHHSHVPVLLVREKPNQAKLGLDTPAAFSALLPA